MLCEISHIQPHLSGWQFGMAAFGTFTIGDWHFQCATLCHVYMCGTQPWSRHTWTHMWWGNPVHQIPLINKIQTGHVCGYQLIFLLEVNEDTSHIDTVCGSINLMVIHLRLTVNEDTSQDPNTHRHMCGVLSFKYWHTNNEGRWKYFEKRVKNTVKPLGSLSSLGLSLLESSFWGTWKTFFLETEVVPYSEGPLSEVPM